MRMSAIAVPEALYFTGEAGGSMYAGTASL